MDDPSISMQEKEKAQPVFLKLIDTANKILQELSRQGVAYTDKQILEGFQEVKQ